jgi:sigma-B regulation protein RsbQ
MMTMPHTPLREMILARNNVQLSGHGNQTILFAHGFGCDQTMWRFVTPAFEDQYRLVHFDYVGCGKSDLSAFDANRYGDLEGYAQDVLEICSALDLRDVIFVGHSVSAMIGLLAANQEPSRFSKLVMLVPSPRFINDPPDYRGGFEERDLEGLLEMMDHNLVGWAGYLAPVVMGNPDKPELTDELQQSFCANDPAAAKVFARATFFADNRADLAKVTVPSLIVQISDDALVPMEVGDYLAANLPYSTRTVLQATGHCPQMSHPEPTIEAIRAFLDRTDVVL